MSGEADAEECLYVHPHPLSFITVYVKYKGHIRQELKLLCNHLCHLTMRREEKKRKFHEAVVNMLFPPSIDNEYDDVPDIIPTEHDTVPLLSDNAGDSYSSLPEEDTNDDGGMELQEKKLTRAQRKRIRKKRLKEESARRGKMIGPLFPSNGDVMCSKGEESCGVAKDDALDSQNDGKLGYDAVPSKGGERSVCDNMKKLKQRRAAKRQAKAVSKLSDSEKKDGNVD